MNNKQQNKTNFDERKERIIIRQSQVKLVLEYLTSCGICPTIQDLLKTTTMMEQYIYDGYSADLMDKIGKLDDYIQTEYKGGIKNEK